MRRTRSPASPRPATPPESAPAAPLLTSELRRVLAVLPAMLRGARDRALLLVGNRPAVDRLEEWVARWCADRRARGLSSVKDDEGRLRKWVLPRLDPALGKRPADSLMSLDLEQLVEDLDQRVRDGELSWKTAKNTWGNVAKLCCEKDSRNRGVPSGVRPVLHVENPRQSRRSAPYPPRPLYVRRMNLITVIWL